MVQETSKAWWLVVILTGFVCGALCGCSQTRSIATSMSEMSPTKLPSLPAPPDLKPAHGTGANLPPPPLKDEPQTSAPSSTPTAASPTPPPVAKAPSEKHQIQIPRAAHDTAIANAFVACEKNDATACPASVGMLVIRTNSSLGQCTAFLVGERLLMTNSHCIPDELKAESAQGADCSGNLQVFFPASGSSPAERATCQEVLTASQIAKHGEADFVLKPDYALILLNREVSRAALALSREGLPDGLALTAFAVDPQSNVAVRGLLRAKTCIARQNSIVASSFTQDFAPVGAFSDCEIIPGNSGSPAVDAEGRVRAIVHATLPPIQTASANTTGAGRKKTQAKAPSPYRPMAMLTNLACTKLPEEAFGSDAATPHEGCEKIASKDDLLKAAAATVKVDELAPLAKAWMSHAPKGLKFAPQRFDASAEAGPVVAPQIACVKPGAKSPLSVELPYWGFRADLDENYRVKMVPDTLETIAIQIKFDAQLLAAQGWVEGHLNAKAKISGQIQTQDKFVLRQCEK